MYGLSDRSRTGLRWRVGVVALALAAAGVAAGCGGEDDGASVRTIGEGSASASGSASGTGSGSASGTGSGTASASASGSGSASGSASGPGAATGALGGYEPVSDVAEHAKVTLDVCEINELLGADSIDYQAIDDLYTQGKNSLDSEGGARALGEFAADTSREEPHWSAYADFYGNPAWLDSFVGAAIDGSGVFEGETDAVRAQGIQKGIQNGILVAWMLHELDAAADDVANGETDPAGGAPHKVDEAWAFYHGAAPDCAPYATADRRGEDFGTGTAVNDAVLAATKAAQTAAAEGDAEALAIAVEEIERGLVVTYAQAALKYSAAVDAALADGAPDVAGVEQAEGLAFFRVIAPLVAAVDEEAARETLAVLELGNEPEEGSGARVRAALEPVLRELGIGPEQMGDLQ